MAALFASVCLVAALPASAQERVPEQQARLLPYPPGVHLFPIVLVSEPEGLRVTLSTEDDERPYLYCTDHCNGWAYEGSYWVAVRSTRKTAAGRTKVRLRRPSEIRVRAQERDQTSAPSTVGLVLTPIGVGLMVLGIATAKEDDRDDHSGAIEFGLGLATLAAGIVLLIVGDSRDTTTPEISVTPLGASLE